MHRGEPLGVVAGPSRPATAEGAGPNFVELSREVRAAGLLDLRPVRFALRIALNTALLSAGFVAFFVLGDSWWQLAVAVFMGFVGGQSAFMWHDAGHKAMYAHKGLATAMGRIHANLINGVSYGWWVVHHNKHHSHPNHLELDPDIGRRTIIFDISQYAQRRGGQKFVVRYQHVMFFVMLVFEAVKLHRTAVLALANRGSVRRPWVEGLLLAAHAAIYLGCLFVVLSPVKALVFLAVQQAVLGLYLGLLFAPNHKGMEIRAEDEEKLDWLERQVLTSRNIRPNPVVDFVYGGLNYQVEHHLFPTMPRMNLGRCRLIVRDYCLRHGMPYHEVGLVRSYAEVAAFLHEVSEPVRQDGPGRPTVRVAA